VQGMDVSGLSDVYLLFHTFPDIIHNATKLPIKSRTKNQTLTPVRQHLRCCPFDFIRLCCYMKKPSLCIFTTLHLLQAWQDSEIPELQLKVMRPEELQYVHLAVVLMDYDALDADDRMGKNKLFSPMQRLHTHVLHCLFGLQGKL
jgi:hypothetical protein